ncbi:Purple acid phosphatase 17 [Tetrabaena socialis]|uniref:Purple acid phosphatase 17 n=1 Tax=Tetrabaena socialis TaxID=47790 RepID=A0A2J8AA47_9CHLO|nr:Purple acid phosphatase 17 [Tetrabaena socialis]|eukprot:PNH09397.1 Purple acid phosphatase 17 [Tetrabaena socialis]
MPFPARACAAAALVALLGALIAEAAAPCGCPLPVMKVKTKGRITFAVLGDWGRVGGVKSLKGPYADGYDFSGICAANFNDSMSEDVEGGEAQLRTAFALEQACRTRDCQFIVNTGDNFYEWYERGGGIDSLLRWKTDFENVYQGPSTPTIAALKWFSVFGNHDIVAPGSIEAQMAYGAFNKRWVMPKRFFGQEVHSADGKIRLRLSLINTSPFVTKYAKANYKYNTTEFRATASPANITAQTDFLAQSLSSSKATWDIVVGHHPLVGSAAMLYGFNSSVYAGLPNATAGVAFDLGRPTADGSPAFAKVLSLLRQYNPVAYMNGHDHILTHAVDPADPIKYTTQYLTSGAGSAADGADSCGAPNRPNVKFSNSKIPDGDLCTAPGGDGVNGFHIVRADASSFKVEFYNVGTYGQASLAYTFTVPTNPNMNRKPSGSCMC